MNPNVITLSHPTYVGPSGATAAATYSFFTKDYKPPSEQRAVDRDVVINQNGKFKYIYDNGPGFRTWEPFTIACEDKIGKQLLGADAATQYARLREMWAYRGIFGMSAPEGTYSVAWSSDLEKNFRTFPAQVGQLQEFQVVVHFEEAA